MAKVALFFKRWKNLSKHKKLNDDWSLATSLKDFSEYGEYEVDDDTSDFDIFPVKYLGCTLTELPRSEEATADAIKSIIATAKAENKKLHRLNMSVCPKGIECFDAITGETILKVSIYKISYCSADATHHNVFAFVAGSKDELAPSEPDTLSCHAFVCQKRKIAHKLTLTVARNFECAFKQWQESLQRAKYQNRLEIKNNIQNTTIHDVTHADITNECIAEMANTNDNLKILLIDFSSETETHDDRRELLQNTWVSFDDEPKINESDNKLPAKIYENNMWERNLICSV